MKKELTVIPTETSSSNPSTSRSAGLLRCGKSCRLRWINYLRTDVKRGNISKEEEDIIIKLHATLGNRYLLTTNALTTRSVLLLENKCPSSNQ
jgi:hypothetical protein